MSLGISFLMGYINGIYIWQNCHIFIMLVDHHNLRKCNLCNLKLILEMNKKESLSFRMSFFQ